MPESVGNHAFVGGILLPTETTSRIQVDGEELNWLRSAIVL
jgi:hypothetical protein